MSWFDLIVVQPIFNLLMVLYALIPGQDFGIAIIFFAVIVRLLMWPLVKKQLHQTRLQREIQPELKKIKKKAKGNKQLEGQMMLELYKERGVNPFAPFGVLLIQLPVFIALFNIITNIASKDRISELTYGFVLNSFDSVAAVVSNPLALNENFLNVIDLTQRGFDGNSGAIYLPLVLLAALSAYLQYYQSKQIMPVPAEKKRLRDILKESAEGKQADQAEISAIMSRRMIVFFPFLAFFISLVFPGALVLFYASSSMVAVVQQNILLREDVEEMEVLAGEKITSDTKQSTQNRKSVASTATTANAPAAKTKSDTSSNKQSNAKKQSKKSRAKRSQSANVSTPKNQSPTTNSQAERSVPKPVQKRRKGSKVK